MNIKRVFSFIIIALFSAIQIFSSSAWAYDDSPALNTGMPPEQRKVMADGGPGYDLNVCSTEPSNAGGDTLDLDSVVSKYNLQSVMIKELGGETVASYKENEAPATPASTMKLVIMDTLLRSGKSLSQNVSVGRDVYYNGSNDLGKSTISLEDAMVAGLKVSSNVGPNVVMKALGGVEDFTTKAQSYGYTHTTVKGYYDPSNDGKNSSTISDQVNAMDHIFSTDGAGYKTAQSALTDAASSDNHYNVDDEANKWAGTSTVAGNVGKFKIKDKEYIIGLYYNGDSESEKAKTAIKDGSAELVSLVDAGGASASAPAAAASEPAGGKSQDEKIAQTFVVGFDASVSKEALKNLVTKFHLGGVYFTGSTDLEGAGFNKSYFDSLNEAAGTDLIIASDEEGGKVQRYEYPSISGGFPSAKEMGKMSDSRVKSIATKVAKELKGDGVTVDLAPVLDLNDGNNIIAQNERSFSGNPDIAAQKAKAFADGLKEGGITPVFKHFPGFGGVGSGNTDTTAVSTPSSYNLDKNIKPYKKALASSGTSGVMLSNIFVDGLTNGKPASISKNAVSYIRNDLNYSGVITTDDLGALSKYSGGKAVGLSTAVAESLEAGVDMPLFGVGTTNESSADSAIQSAIDKVKATVPDATIDKAYQQVSAFKGASPNAGSAADNNSSGGCCTTSNNTIPAGTLPTIIPEPYNGAFTAGAEKYDVAPGLIAALFSEENALGGDTHDPDPSTVAAGWASFVKRHSDPNSGWPVSDQGATGPFQFLPSTWTGFGFDIKDINNLAVAAEAAAKYAQTNGATKDKSPEEWRSFIFNYNHADWYVDAVLEYYNYYNGEPAATPGEPTTVTSTDSSSQGCSNNSNTGNVRQDVVNIATAELNSWKDQPDYNKDGTAFKYAEKGYFKYSQNRTEDWCADFASWVFNEADRPLDSPDWNVPAVVSIAEIGKQNSGFYWHQEGDGYTPKPGDIAVHGTGHVNILVKVENGQVTYIGGNQGGPPYPGGSRVTEYSNTGFYSGGVTGYVTVD